MLRFTRAAMTAALALISVTILSPGALAQPDIRGRFNGFGQSTIIGPETPGQRSFFDVFIDDTRVYTNQETYRFPEDQEIFEQIDAAKKS